MKDPNQALSGLRAFSRIDLVWAQKQIPFEKANKAKSAGTAHFGLFEFLRIPLGLSSTAQTLQNFMHCHTRFG